LTICDLANTTKCRSEFAPLVGSSPYSITRLSGSIITSARLNGFRTLASENEIFSFKQLTQSLPKWTLEL